MLLSLTFSLSKCIHLQYLGHVSLIIKMYGLLQLIISYVLLHNCAISFDSCSPVNRFYSFIIFSLLINVYFCV